MAKEKTEWARGPGPARKVRGAERCAGAPDAYPMSVDEFVQTYERGREVEMKAGFRVYAKPGGVDLARTDRRNGRHGTRAFRNRPVG